MKRSNYENFRLYRESNLAQESNLVELEPESLLSIALVFPNSYPVGMANLGFQSIYRLFNEMPGVRCERAFLYDRFPGIAQTLETGRHLRDFDIIAFSVSYELDFPNLVQILLDAGITPFAAERHSREPLVMAGGAIAFMNPTPIEPFIDLFYLGEIEPQVRQLLSTMLKCKQQRSERKETLDQLSELPGIYLPARKADKSIARVYSTNDRYHPQYSPIISPNCHFKNMFLVEVGRGCGRYCRFCAASHIYHPFRIFSQDRILSTIDRYHQNTRRIGLIGAALSDYPQLHALCETLVDQGYELGLSSFRLDMITPEFLKVLERGQVRSLTFAPEAGTERLRWLIHKNLSDQQIINAAEAIAYSKVQQLKLYFMIGLPNESEDDLVGIIELVKSIQKITSKRKKAVSLMVSINTFIPKPFTPFQWSPMLRETEIRRKRKFLERELRKLPGVQVARKNVKDEILQGMFSLGDQRIAKAIHFKLTQHVDWSAAWKQAGIDPDFIHQPRPFDTILPWDFIKSGFEKRRLLMRGELAQSTDGDSRPN
ncbi:MAG: radical SAM protein [candidate division KSB1 bacterium]|nr:radical SAM protein [candidate division KSB1 bacterium]MDZ7333762.1 radical SAM protein [candidate division KSB1 bacterium]MDZ7358632.1 radical SAM protein [candidate division KSB1 bacterium]MDZ7400522.1 radical SAM protein [candidate division KSB1 bacterium]